MIAKTKLTDVDMTKLIENKVAFTNEQIGNMNEKQLSYALNALIPSFGEETKNNKAFAEVPLLIEKAQKTSDIKGMRDYVKMMQAQVTTNDETSNALITNVDDYRLRDEGDGGRIEAEKISATNIIDGIEVINDKVGEKIPIEIFQSFRISSVKNPSADSMTLGRYTTGTDSYIIRAGSDSSYFDLGTDWNKIKDDYGLTDQEMFDYFNKPALYDALIQDKTIRFSHDPRNFDKGFLVDEWEYIKEFLKVDDSNLIYKGGFWYVQ